DCSVNFVTKTLTMTTSSDQKEEVFRQTERKVHRLEPHVRMVVKNARGRLREDSRSNAGAVQSDSTEDCACGHEHDGEGEGHTHEVGQHAAHSHAGHHHGAHGKQA
ncbi:heavy metal translocating P-type ATPase, partial [Bacillus cereus]|nr:heavy metal translocating P-type ATPase [Bacillus cereus]